MRQKAPKMAAIGLIMILAQCFTAFAVGVGVLKRSCDSNLQCQLHATWCSVGDIHRCEDCANTGGDVPLAAPEWIGSACPGYIDNTVVEGRTEGGCLGPVNATVIGAICHDPLTFVAHQTEKLAAREGASAGQEREQIDEQYRFMGELTDNYKFDDITTVESWCENCFNDGSNKVSRKTRTDRAHENIGSMRAFDWVTYVLAAYVVSLSIVAEIKDIVRIKSSWILSVSFAFDPTLLAH